MDVLQELTISSSRKNHRTPPISILRDSEVANDTPGKSAATFFGASDTSSSFELGHIQIDFRRDGAERTRPATDGPEASLGPCPF